MPYIALQLVGMKVVFAALGLHGEWPLLLAFVVLAAYTYSSGLRAPAVIAIVKDVMIYVMVAAALIFLPLKLGSYAHIFAVASQRLASHTPTASIFIQPSQYLGYSTLAIGSAIALMLYPHTATAVLSAKSGDVIRRNAALLPAYSLLLGLIALLGYMAFAAGVSAKDSSEIVPLLFLKMFPEWFAGFCLAAVAIGALVPAAIMSIAAANLFTRNLLGEFLRSPLSDRAESSIAKLVSLAVKFGALAFVLEVEAKFAIELQLLGGVWMVQLFPSVVLGVFTRWFHPRALGWGTWMAAQLGLKSSVYPLHLFGHTCAMYAAIPALLLNLAVSALVTLLLQAFHANPGSDATVAADFA